MSCSSNKKGSGEKQATGSNRTSIPKHNMGFSYRSLQPSFLILVGFVCDEDNN